ncbi:hypothetical protein [Marinobacter sp. CA1]|uniref:hypothetical protein n=1 Tax=Marinobacter sp. CA1 TaxID=2817656 RepID=UPI001D085B40|nr:hypothetical protein [Marinobacter sp. CA1]UDL07148.1 hypothetical protein J2887_10515 [Marinobacter sp. CA1]
MSYKISAEFFGGMKLYPEYSENIIAYVVSGGVGTWYVVEKDECFLDRVSLSSVFGQEADQSDIELLDSLTNGNGKLLIERFKEFEVSTDELQELMQLYQPLASNESVLEMRPSVYIDLDLKVLKNLFPEPSGVFEKFAPKNWSSAYDDFWGLIPVEKIFWVIDGESRFLSGE